ncbi:MAG TPA: trigger factor [Pyrinomonadaceae bacterium]|nr:trigger factor [Pyrinomonadaceae bacterium]
MKTEIVDVSETKKELKLEIAPEEVRAELDRVSETYARQVSVPGFRKGHAPVSVIRTRFKNEIRGEVLQKIVPDAVNRAISESGLEVLGQPDVHLDTESLDRLGQEPLKLHAHFEVMPRVELGQYRGLEGTRRTRPVTDEMVEDVIRGLRENSASLLPVEDRGAEEGDTVTANFRGKFLGDPGAEDINAEEVEVVIGGEGVQPEFNEHLAGAREGDERTFTVKYPDDFRAQGLAGKEVEYTAAVTSVRRKTLPEVDDEWAKSLGEEIESVESLRGRVRENLTARSRFESEGRLRDELVKRLVDSHRFEVPDTLADYQADQMLRSAVNDMMRHGIDPRAQELDWDGMRASARERAAEDLRAHLLLERIADAENIEVTDEEVDAELKALAEAHRQPVEQVRAALTKQGGERSIADRLRNRKALDLIVENAAVSDEEWREEEPPAAPERSESAEPEATSEESRGAAADEGR